ncbi:MAG TPA: orotidine-5'-phosphate decarboxylase [Cellvibrionaceae bacterium]
MRASPQPQLVVAMDYDNVDDCLAMAHRLSPDSCRLKVGKELFTCCGPAVVERLIALGYDVFLDLKFHDIPNTTAQAVRAAADLGVWMVNVHASGGERMMIAAREVLGAFSQPPLLIGVTVLTSMGEEDLRATGVVNTPEQQVLHLARLAKVSGLDGVVCSAREARALKRECGEQFQLVTPGIRSANSQADDQHRTMTPKEALLAGSDYLVVGRPITRATDPLLACQQLLDSLR